MSSTINAGFLAASQSSFNKEFDDIFQKDCNFNMELVFYMCDDAAIEHW